MSAAADIAIHLGARAEEVCRRYLPHGRRQGRYWVAGDLDGAKGRSLFVRLAPPGVPGKWTDAATGEHGDLLDLIRHRSGAPTLRAAFAEARDFLALEPAPDSVPGLRRQRATAARTIPPKRPAASGGSAEPSTEPTPNPIFTPAASRAAASRRCASTPRFATAKAPPCTACRRWSPP